MEGVAGRGRGAWPTVGRGRPRGARRPAPSLLGWRESPPRPLGGRLPAPLGSMEEKPGAGCTILMAAAACGTKAMSLFKRTLVLSPAAAPKGAGTPSRCCPWPSKDWTRGEGVCARLRRPAAAGFLPQSHACSTTATTSVCLLCPQDSLSSSLKTCYKYLHQTSRSFAAVIQALDEEMR